MSPQTRRDALQVLTAGLAVGIAGCLDETTTETRVEQLHAVNYDHDAHTIHLEITDDGEPAYEDAIDVPAAAEEATEWGDGGWGQGRFEAYPTEPGAYAIHTWRGDQSRDERRTLEQRVRVRLRRGDDPDRRSGSTGPRGRPQHLAVVPLSRRRLRPRTT